MNAALDSKKIALIQQISTIQNKIILDRISVLIATEIDKDSTVEEKKSIKKGLEDAKNGKLISHTKVKASYAKWL